MLRIAVLSLLAAAVLAPTALGNPIPPGGVTTLPAYRGAPATARPVKATRAPQNPYLAHNPSSNIHDDTWMTDAYQRSGPLGRNPVATSGGMPPSLCGSLTFDRAGRILSVCPSSGGPPQARIIDPGTLAVRATFDLPTAPDPPGTKTYQNFTGGGYFFLDGHDRMWIATKTSHLFVLAERNAGTALAKVADYDLTSVLTSDERITSALPDFRGRIWFVSKKDGVIGILNTHTRHIGVRKLNEEVENSFAVGRDGIYIVSDKAMYRLRATRSGRPHVVWRTVYANSGVHKPSQVDAGSGTTPTIMSGGMVAITDNADPMNVVVYRNRDGRRICQQPVFTKGASATENSLITAGRALIVENNYGYQDPFGPQTGALTQPGFARVDVNARHTGCRLVWTNTTERAPTVVPKLSTRTGLIYTYTRDEDLPGSQPWFWTALDVRTGKTVFKQYAGNGLGFNNNYAGIALGPDGTAYLGVFGGMIALRDGG